MSRRVGLTVLALLPAVVWVVQIGFGLTAGPVICESRTALHLTGGAFLAIAVIAVTLSVLLRGERESSTDQLTEFINAMPVRVGMLFTVGIALTWMMGWFWPC